MILVFSLLWNRVMVTMLQVICAMSLFLVLTLFLLLSGAAISAFLVRRRNKYSSLFGAAMLFGILVIWVIAGRQLPLELAINLGSKGSSAPFWSFFVDDVRWHLTAIILLLAGAVFLALDVWERSATRQAITDQLNHNSTPMIFMLITAALLSLWSNSLITLIQSWALFIICWTLFHGVTSGDEANWRTIFYRGCFLCTSLIFLWLANVSNGDSSGYFIDIQEWAGQSAHWTMVAAAIFLGLIFLHWWRPLGNQALAPLDSLTHLIPTIIGGWLFIQVGTTHEIGGFIRLAFTILSLIGLFAGATLSWANSKQPKNMPPYLALAFVNLVVLSTLWSDGAYAAEAAISELTISLLAIAGLFLFSFWSDGIGKVERLIGYVFVLALAGLPLTIGFDGRLKLYQELLSGGQLLLTLAISLVLTTVLGAAFLVIQKRDGSAGSTAGGLNLEKLATFLLLALGLVGFSGINTIIDNFLPLLLILLPVVGGFALSRYSGQAYEVEQTVEEAVMIDLPRRQLKEYLVNTLTHLAAIIREGAAIFEGEGGMLWLLIIVLILWLARFS